MKLTNARVTLFRSIEDSGDVPIDPEVTVLVGQNESGKTAFLQALYKSNPVEGSGFNVVEDYPRRYLNTYQREHEAKPATATVLTYELEKDDIDAINADLGFKLITELSISLNHTYKNEQTIGLQLSESQYVEYLRKAFPADVADKLAAATTVRKFLTLLAGADLNETSAKKRDELKAKFSKTPENWTNALNHYVWSTFIAKRVPKFLYFDEYRLLPGKVNLNALQAAVQSSNQSKQPLDDEYKTVMSLLRMAGVTVQDLMNPASYENIKAKLEGISNSITDRVFEYWRQNTELDVEFDIRVDPQDRAPFNSGSNLYIRIRNRRHRVSVPFSQRSRGFIWFFSFIVWFDSIRDQLGTADDLILLLDEPGLSLHALAQADFLRYIDQLSSEHQVVYTTHSPFMVRDDRLFQARAVEDRSKEGTRVTANISGSDPKTVFPLQAALGYTIAQNLFISRRNLLVEGPSDLIYLKFFSAVLEKAGKKGLRDDITIVPVGGLDKLATFIALLGANQLEMVVLHDYQQRPDPHLTALVRERLIRDKNVLHFGMFRNDASAASGAVVSTDIEDLLSPDLYLSLFNATFADRLPKAVGVSDLPVEGRILARLSEYLTQNSIQLRPSGGFNHYLIATYLASHPPATTDTDTLAKFEALFAQVNRLYSGPDASISD